MIFGVLGVLSMLGSIVLLISGLFGLLPLTTAFMAAGFLGFILSIIIIVVGFFSGGIAETFAGAKFFGKEVVALQIGRKLVFVSGKNENGLIKTKFGYFATTPDSVCIWPNSVTGGVAYYKYGVLVPIRVVKALKEVKKLGIKDGKQLSKIAEKKPDTVIKLE